LAHLVKTLIPNVTFFIADGPPLSIADAQTTVTLDDISFSHIPQSAFASSTTVPTELTADKTDNVNAPYQGLYYSNTGSRTAFLQDLGTTTGAVSVQANFVAADTGLTSSQNATAAAVDLTTTEALANALKANYNQLQVDVANLRTAFNAELAALQTAGGPQKSS
jgi:hypothetical protein